MCDERERLIDYLYDEGEPRQNAEVQAHLAECATCRSEISDLRAVRQDLMAWSVPTHQPVWRPTPPARAALTWRDVPTWALAAAAAVVLMAGISGAAVSQLLLPFRTPGGPTSASRDGEAGTATRTAADPTSTPGVTPEQLQRVSARLDEVEARLTRQVEILASHQTTRVSPTQVAAGDRATLDDLTRRVSLTEDMLRLQNKLNTQLLNSRSYVSANREDGKATPISYNR